MTAPPNPRFRVLVADDDQSTRLLFRAALTGKPENSAGAPADVELVLCAQAEEAVAAVEGAAGKQRPFAVVFLDVSMPPGPDGVWAAERIRALDPRVQIVMVTAHSEARPNEISRRVPPQDKMLYLRKPIHPLELQSCAAAFGAKWMAEQEVAAAQRELEARVERRTAQLARMNERLREYIAHRRRAEEQIAHQAFHDALTGLPNRLLFNDRLGIAIAHARRHHRGLAILFLDLDDFKTINDSLGHAAGDELLKVVAGRLEAYVRDEDTVARLGGDEFVILLQDAHDPNYAVQVAERVLASISEPISVKGHEIHTSASIGITLYPDDGEDAETLVSNADIAMYRAKEHGRSTYKLFTPAMNEAVMERMALELGLRRALKRHEFVTHYQPILDLDSGRIIGMEALVRWQKPGEGMIDPLAFIPLAEETGLIIPLGEWVLRTACGDAKRWHDQGFDHLFVSVNLSPRQFQTGNVAAAVKEVLEETGLPAHCLTLELTEGAVMRNVDEAILTMRSLSALGVKLSMDDFGRGYSSLSHLKSFPMSTLKIDGSFVGDLTTDPSDASIVRAIISMGRSLSLSVVAEGVETEEQLEFLRDHSCDHVQGFLMGRPAPPEEIDELLQKERR